MHAWWSDKMCAISGYVVYTNAAGEHVKCTMVHATNDSSYAKWDDLQYLGEVVDFVESFTQGLDNFPDIFDSSLSEEDQYQLLKDFEKKILKGLGHEDTCRCVECIEPVMLINSRSSTGLN